MTSSTFQGGGDRSRSRTLCIGFQYRDKFKGGGVITPVTPPPWIRHCILGLGPWSTNKKKGGVSNFGPNVKKPTSWPKRGGGSGPPAPPPWIRYWVLGLSFRGLSFLDTRWRCTNRPWSDCGTVYNPKFGHYDVDWVLH